MQTRGVIEPVDARRAVSVSAVQGVTVPGALHRPVARVQQLMAFQPSIQRSTAQPQALGGGPLVSSLLGQHPNDVIPFNRIQIVGQRRWRRVAANAIHPS